MLIFRTNQNQVYETKQLSSSKVSIKDMGYGVVILGIRIKRVNKGILMTQSHYVEKILKRFNFSDCSPLSTPLDRSVKFLSNLNIPISQFEYYKVINILMYVMTSTKINIVYALGWLSMYTSNHSAQH